MATPLEHAIDNVGSTDFEKLVPEFLKEVGYEVKTSGEHGTDGGWDAFIQIGQDHGVAHASKQKSWRKKLRSDADSSAELEEELGKDFDLFVFVTNQQPTGQQELDLRREISEGYGWDLTIFHRRDLISTLGTDRPDLAERFLGVDPQRRQDNLEKIKDIQIERTEIIRQREGVASVLDAGPVIVVHLLPNGMTSTDYVSQYEDIPNPPVFDRIGNSNLESMGRAKYATNGIYEEDETTEYAFIRMDGLYETVSTDFFYGQSDEPFITNRSDGRGLDTRVNKAVNKGMACLLDMGVSGPVFCFISLLEVEGFRMTISSHVSVSDAGFRGFTTNEYTTNPITIDDLTQDGSKAIKGALDEIWREIGRPQGSPNYDDDGNWTGPRLDR